MKYTLEITANEKNFPTSQLYYTEKVRARAMDIYFLIHRANNVPLTDNMINYNRRKDFQRKAIDACQELSALIELGRSLLHMSGKRATYWTDKTDMIESHINKWMTSDEKRFKEIRSFRLK